jgi:hypothetical protein
MDVDALLVDCCCSPLLVHCGGWYGADDVFVHRVWEGTCENAQNQVLIDIVASMTYQLFEFRNEFV